MNKQVSSLTNEQLNTQEVFWTWISKSVRNLVAEASCIFRCPTREAAMDVAVAWRNRRQTLSPWPVYQFMEGLSDSLNFYNLPMWRWKRARTNNPMERLIKTLRQRLRPMGCFYDDLAIERAVFGQLLRWHKIKLTYNTLRYLDNRII